MKTKRFSWLLALAALAPAALAAQGITPRPAEGADAPDHARDLYYVSDAQGQGKNVGVRVRLYQAEADCDIVSVSPRKTFTAGERLRFGVETNSNGYLYILQRGSSGRSTLLFPHPEIARGSNAVKRGVELVIPGRNWFTFDANPGNEELTFIVSKKKMDIVNYLVPPAGGGVAAAPAAGSDMASVLAALQREGDKDLVLSPESGSGAIVTTAATWNQPVYAVNSGQGKGDFCVVKFRLNHR